MTARPALVLAAVLAARPIPASSGQLLVPDELPLPTTATVVHDYGPSRLVVLPDEVPTSGKAASRWIPLAVAAAPRMEIPATTASGDDPVLWRLELVGPADPAWLESLRREGLQLLAAAGPYGLIVRCDRAELESARALRTSSGLPAVVAIRPVTAHDRLDPEALGAENWRVAPWPLARSRHLPHLPATDPATLLADPAIAWVEPEARPARHGNLAVGAELLAIEPVWRDLGFDGAGVVVAHNDSGVDQSHPDLAGEVILATTGFMTWTDSAHGTHTAALIAGRGRAAAPAEGGACTPLAMPAATVSGAAPGARLVTNNLFEGGFAEIPAMMEFAARHGAVVSSNSWGEIGQNGPDADYTASAAAVDAAVADASPDLAGVQPLTVVFSAGNTGPDPQTVTSPGTAKNAITVGATQNLRCGTWVPDLEAGPDPERVIASSARGPSQGRIKPDLVATGADMVAAGSADSFARFFWDAPWTGPRHALYTGTSQPAALVAGAAAIVVQARREATGRDPSPAAVKALLLNGTRMLPGVWPSYDQGWGRLDLLHSLTGPPGGRVLVYDSIEPLTSGQRWTTTFEVLSAAEPLRLTLVWTDPPAQPGSTSPLVNDLDLLVTSADGAVYRGNRFADAASVPDPGATADRQNTVEVVRVPTPSVGTWSLEVVGANVIVTGDGGLGQTAAVALAGLVERCRLAPPAEVSAITDGPNRVRVEWTPVVGASGYRVERALATGDLSWQVVAEVDGETTAWVDDEVSGGVDFQWVVRAVGDCVSEPSPEATASPTGECRLAPQPIAQLTAADRTTSRCGVHLEWSGGASPCSEDVVFDVYAATDGPPEIAPDDRIAAGLPSPTFDDEELSPGVARHYRVQARGLESGLVGPPTEAVAATASGPPLTWWTDDGRSSDRRVATPAASPADSLSHSWRRLTDPLPAGGRVWFCPDDDTTLDRALELAEDLLLPAEPAAVLRFRHRWGLDDRADGGVLEYSTDGGASWFDIRAGDGARIPADPGRITSGGYTGVLSASDPGQPLAGRAAWTGIRRDWLESTVDLSDFAGSRLRLRWRSGCGTSGALGGGWWVDDIAVEGPSACSPCTPPPPPEEVRASPTAEGVVIDWGPVAAADSWTILRAADTDPLLPVATVPGGDRSWLDTTASAGTPTRWAVRAVAGGCASAVSAETAATPIGRCTRAPLFGGVRQVLDRAETRCAVELRWTAATATCPDAELRYELHRLGSATAEPDGTSLVATGLTATGFVDRTVPPDLESWWLVRARDLASGIADDNLHRRAAISRGPTVVGLLEDAEEASGRVVTATGSDADTGTPPWRRVTGAGGDGERAWFCPSEGRVTDQTLATATAIQLPAGRPVTLDFRQRVDLEAFWDGGVLEYSTDGGASWHDILSGDGGTVPAAAGRFVTGGYDVSLGGSDNPLSGRPAWTGGQSVWIDTRVDLSDLAGHEVMLRWRLGCDGSRARTGWWLDSIRLWWPTRCLGPDEERTRPAVRTGAG